MKWIHLIQLTIISIVAQDLFAQSDTCEFEIDSISGRRILLYGDVMPEFPGGNDSLFAFLVKNLTWPEDDGANYMGTVIVSFIIEPDGSITNKNIVKSIYPKADTAVLKVIDKMPKWIPGKCKDSVAPFKTFIPIRFQITI